MNFIIFQILRLRYIILYIPDNGTRLLKPGGPLPHFVPKIYLKNMLNLTLIKQTPTSKISWKVTYTSQIKNWVENILHCILVEKIFMDSISHNEIILKLPKKIINIHAKVIYLHHFRFRIQEWISQLLSWICSLAR